MDHDIQQQILESSEEMTTQRDDFEAAIWRLTPNTYTIPCELNNFAEPDPFEGPGETYHDAYHRVLKELHSIQEFEGIAKSLC